MCLEEGLPEGQGSASFWDSPVPLRKSEIATGTCWSLSAEKCGQGTQPGTEPVSSWECGPPAPPVEHAGREQKPSWLEACALLGTGVHTDLLSPLPSARQAGYGEGSPGLPVHMGCGTHWCGCLWKPEMFDCLVGYGVLQKIKRDFSRCNQGRKYFGCFLKFKLICLL